MQQKKGINIFCGYTFDIWYPFDIANNKTTDKYKYLIIKQYIYKAKNSEYSWTQPTKRLYQFHHRNQLNISTLSCIPIICYFKTL